MLSVDSYILGAGILLLLSLIASKASARLGVPSLLLFLAIGMMTGSDGPGGIPFDNVGEAQALGTVALVFILFQGGMQTQWHHVRPVAWQAASLATVGVVVSAVVVAWFVRLLGRASWPEALLLGSMVASTDAAALFSVMRSQGVDLKGHLNALLELESGANDPMAVFLTTTFVALLAQPHEFTVPQALWELFREMGAGAALGVVFGRLGLYVASRVTFPSDGLYVPLTTGIALFTYGLTEIAHGSGFLAVYLAGMMLGSGEFPRKQMLNDAHDGIAWLMQIGMFLTLGLLVFPSQLPPVAAVSLVVAFFLVLVARPLSVFVALALTRLTWREKVIVSWCGLRGAVPIILATFPLLAQIPEAWTYFNIVFFIVLVSVLVQGTTVPYLATRLGLRRPREEPPKEPEDQECASGREEWKSEQRESETS